MGQIKKGRTVSRSVLKGGAHRKRGKRCMHNPTCDRLVMYRMVVAPKLDGAGIM